MMLTIDSISFAYAENTVLDNLSFAIPQGNHLAIIGESGCGKSTLLKLIYGIYDLDGGEIIFDNEPIRGPKYNLLPGRDSIQYLAQDFGLMPYITVAENVGKYLSNSNTSKKNARVAELLELVGLSELGATKAQFLSGGQQQRNAIAMALASEPKLLLLDEPFSQIDRFRTNTLRRSIYKFCKENRITVVVASHDSDDILPFADQVAVMKNGKIIRSGSPLEIYNQPESIYTASLFGEVNEIPAHLLGIKNSNENIILYPHQLRVSSQGLKGIVVESQFYGNYFLIQCTHDNLTLFITSTESVEAGRTIFITYKK